MTDVIATGLAVSGFGLLLFGLGAISGWLWGVKSPLVTPPVWITAVTIAAGASLSAAAALHGDWLSATLAAFICATIVAGQRQVGPFRRSGREAP